MPKGPGTAGGGRMVVPGTAFLQPMPREDIKAGSSVLLALSTWPFKAPLLELFTLEVVEVVVEVVMLLLFVRMLPTVPGTVKEVAPVNGVLVVMVLLLPPPPAIAKGVAFPLPLLLPLLVTLITPTMPLVLTLLTLGVPLGMDDGWLVSPVVAVVVAADAVTFTPSPTPLPVLVSDPNLLGGCGLNVGMVGSMLDELVLGC